MPAKNRLDRAAIEKLRALGGEPLLREMIGLFLEHTPRRLAALRAGFEKDDRSQVYRAAHSLKSSAANLGATRVEAAAAALEGKAETAPPSVLRPLIRRLEAAFQAAVPLLKVERSPRKRG